MSRLITVAALASGALAALVAPAHAQSQAEIAAKYNEEGKELMYSNKYPEATGKFQQAVARVPEPKYFFNLCTSLFQEGRFGEALTACNAVEKNNPSPEQTAKTEKLTSRIRDEAKHQNIKLEPVGGGAGPGDCASDPSDPACGEQPQVDPGTDPGQPPPPVRRAVGRPPSGTGVFTSTVPDNKYTWTLGAEFFGGGGQIGRKDYYGTSTAGFRLKGDVMLNPAQRIGVQGYLQATHLGEGKMDSPDVTSLDVIDLGVAAYKHLCPRGAQRLCLTPLIGVHLAMMSPAGDSDGYGSQVFNYAGVGGRAELAAQYAFGARYEYVLGLMVGANAYSRVLSGPSDDGSFDDSELSIERAGLDKGGIAAYVGLGFTYRFNTPLGSAAFITLE